MGFCFHKTTMKSFCGQSRVKTCEFRSNVRRAAFDRSSLMPEGLLETMKEQDVSDLFTFLRTLK